MTSTSHHIAFRLSDQQEAYLPATGLSVWEIVWIAQYHEGNATATARTLGIDSALVQEALYRQGIGPTQ